jgi:hypothetical protein
MNGVPRGICLQLCKRIIDDQRTGLRSLIDLITRFYVDDFPSTRQDFFVNVALTGGVGNHDIEVRIVRTLDMAQIYYQRHVVNFPDITDILQLFFEIRSVRFPWPGYYFVEVLVDGALLTNGRRRIEVQRLGGVDDD